MAIVKQAKNIYSQIENDYMAIIGNFVEMAEELIVDSIEENISLSSNKNIVTIGDVEQ